MSEEKSSLFRKKVIDRVSTPEELDHYLQVTSPGIWIALIAVVVFLVGVLCWAVFGRIEKTVNVAVVKMDADYVGNLMNDDDARKNAGTEQASFYYVCLLNQETKNLYNEGSAAKDYSVTIGNKKYSISSEIELDPVVLGGKDGQVDLKVKQSLKLKNGDRLYPVIIEGEPEFTGNTCIGKFTLELVKPIELIIN